MNFLLNVSTGTCLAHTNFKAGMSYITSGNSLMLTSDMSSTSRFLRLTIDGCKDLIPLLLDKFNTVNDFNWVILCENSCNPQSKTFSFCKFVSCANDSGKDVIPSYV